MGVRSAIVVAIALLSFPAACTESVPRTLPELTLGRTLFGAAAAVSGSDHMTLAEAYRLALARSEQVALAERDVDNAGIEWNERLTEIGPTVNLTVSGYEQREQVAGANVLRPSEQLVGAVVVDQPVFRRGFFDSRAAGRHRYESARAALTRAREQLARQVAATFIDVIKFRRLLELAHASVKRATSQRAFAVARVKAGQALKNAELLAQIDVKRAERQEVNAQRDVGASEVTFARLVGRPPPPDLERPPMPALPDRRQAVELARKRGDVGALELRVSEARDEESSAAGRRLWPRLDITANVQYLNPQVLNTTIDWQVIGILTIPLFQGGREYTELARRENATHAAQLALEQTRKIAVEEAELASLETTSAARAVDLAKEELDVAREHYDLVDKQVRLGAITFLEVANAQAVLVEAENAFEVATMDRLRAAYDYLYAIGGLDVDTIKPAE